MKVNVKMRQYVILALLGLWWQSAAGYRILCLLPLPSRSHGHLARGFVDPLLKAGHQVTWVTSYGDWKKAPNLTMIVVPQLVDLIKEVGLTEHRSVAVVKKFAQDINRITIANEQVQKMMKGEQFDAVVTEWFLTDHDAGYAAVLQVPWIQLCGTAMHSMIENQVDEVRSMATVPFLMLEMAVPMSFWERICSTAFSGFMLLSKVWERPAAAATYEAHFGPLAKARGVALPPFSEAMHNISIQFVNSHPSISPAIAQPPNVIDIGGYHIEEETALLPKDLQDIMDGSPQGVVYFSMGSVFTAADMPDETARELANMLGELSHTVLWKYDAPLQGLPPNVHIRPWFPQASVLAHPNTVLFITHGGQLSLLEAVKRGVPLLALPVFGDQPANAARAVRLGLARSVPWSPRAVGELRRQLHHMLGDGSYLQRARQLALEFNSRPLPPRRLLTHYVELAIQTKGALHLRSVSRLYPWWSRWMLDQLLAAVLLLATIKCALTLLWNTATNWRQNTQKSKTS